MNHWDSRYPSLAAHVARWSKDPSTKCGAVIVAPDNRVVSLGFNGFPRGIADDARLDDREAKYKIVVHCERNALLFAREPLHGCTLYTWPFASCSVCAAMVIQAGISRVAAPPCPPDKRARWQDDLDLAESLFAEAGVRFDIIEESPF